MAEIRWTPHAADEFEAIAEFISADSSHYASLFAMNVLAVIERLAKFPSSGRVVPELGNPVLREILYGSYRIVYRINAECIEILTIHHGARLLDVSKLM